MMDGYVSEDSKKQTLTHRFPQTLVEETFSREIYENTHSLLRELLTEMSSKVEGGINIKLSPSEQSLSSSSSSAPSTDSSSSSGTVSGSVGLEGSFSKKSMIKDVTEYTTIKVKIKKHWIILQNTAKSFTRQVFLKNQQGS